MVTAMNLSAEMIEDGAQLLAKLDTTGPPIEAALWLFSEDPAAWQLLFAVRNVATVGPRVFYKSAQRAFGRAPLPKQLKLEDLRLAGPNASLITAIRSGFRVQGGRARVTNSIFGGHRIADALIYRS